MYELRKAEANEKKPVVQYLQNSILVHVDYKQEETADNLGEPQTFWSYKEFVFPLGSSLAEIDQGLNAEGYRLTKEIEEAL